MRVRSPRVRQIAAALLVAALAPPELAHADEAPDVGPLVARVGPSVVRLSLLSGDEEEGNGTGFFLRADGLVVTNHHVIEGAAQGRLVAVLRDGRKLAVLGLVADDEEHDLAIVRVEGKDFPALELAPSASIHVGERLILVGSPMGFDQSASSGILSALRADFPDEWKKRHQAIGRKTTGPLVQHTAPSAPGASGSPLVDAEGRVVAINHSGFEGTDLNFAAHVDALRALIARTNLDGKPRPLGNLRRNLVISSVVFAALLLAVAAAWLAGRGARRRSSAR